MPENDEIQISHHLTPPRLWLVSTWCLLRGCWQGQLFEVLWAARLWVWPHVPFCFYAAVPRLSVLPGWHFTVAPTTAVGHWTSVSHCSGSLSRLCAGLLCVYFQHSLWGCVQHTLMLVLFGTSCEPHCPCVHSMSLLQGLFMCSMSARVNKLAKYCQIQWERERVYCSWQRLLTENDALCVLLVWATCFYFSSTKFHSSAHLQSMWMMRDLYTRLRGSTSHMIHSWGNYLKVRKWFTLWTINLETYLQRKKSQLAPKVSLIPSLHCSVAQSISGRLLTRSNHCGLIVCCTLGIGVICVFVLLLRTHTRVF